MFRWTKESATAELKALIEEIPDLAKRRRHCAEHTRWGIRALRVLEQVFGEKSRYYLSFAYLKWSTFPTSYSNRLNLRWKSKSVTEPIERRRSLQK